MTFPLFTDLPEQREGPITVNGQTLVACPACEGGRSVTGWGLGDPEDAENCPECNGGRQILVRTP